VFTQLEKGQHRICYASPEILLRNSSFKKLFRLEYFRRSLVAIVVDEAHVIESWKDDFRKDYGELETLRIIAGTEIPWLALTATCTTRTFETIYQSLGMGGQRPFYGIDLGADRPNIAQWVRPMEHSATSLHDILAFVPVSPKSPSDFKKTIFYFKTRQLCRQARDLCRAVVAPELRKVMFAFTAVCSEEFKLKVINMLRDGKDVRWMFATIAAGMGTNIPDIEQSIIFGVSSLGETFQKGGRAGRSATMNAIMIWIVEPWVFEPRENNASKPGTKKLLGEEEKRQKMDQNAREYINHSQSPFCMRVYAASHFRPEPNLPGFKWYRKLDGDDSQEECLYASVTWEVVEQEIRCGNGMCSASVCRKNPDVAVGVLSIMDHQIIAIHLNTLKGQNSVALRNLNHPSDSEDGTTNTSPGLLQAEPTLRCSKPERQILHEALLSWRDTEWAGIKPCFPFFRVNGL
jgi:superfamily II DNA helicase RecQ